MGNLIKIQIMLLTFFLSGFKNMKAQFTFTTGSDNSDIVESSQFGYDGLNGWSKSDYFGNNIYAMHYQNEYYLIGIKDAPYGGRVSKDIYINNNRNYIITTTFKTIYVASNEKYFAGVVLSDGNNRIVFDITWGEFIIQQVFNGKGFDIVPWKLSNSINGNTSEPEKLYNHIEIEKKNGDFYFSINGNFVQKISIPSWFKFTTIGFEVSNNTEIAVDYINVLYK